MNPINPNTDKVQQSFFPLSLQPSSPTSFPLAYSDNIWDVLRENTAMFQISGQIGQYTQHDVNEMIGQYIADIVESLGLGCLYMGIATPAIRPQIGARGFYLALTDGTYTNFLYAGGTAITIDKGEIAAIVRTGSAWTKEHIMIRPYIDPVSKHWMVDGQDSGIVAEGVDGESAYEVWLDAGNQGTVQDFLNSLKATVGAFKPVDYDSNAPSTIGGTATTVGGVTASASTKDVIVLMPNAASDPTATRMYITNEVSTSPVSVEPGEPTDATEPTVTYQFVYIGDLSVDLRFGSGQSLNDVDIVNDLTTGGVGDVLSAEQGKVLEGEISQLDQKVDDIVFWSSEINYTGSSVTKHKVFPNTLTKDIPLLIESTPEYINYFMFRDSNGTDLYMVSVSPSGKTIAYAPAGAKSLFVKLKSNLPSAIVNFTMTKLGLENNAISERQNNFIAGFTPTPINFDNTNSKITFNDCYFRINGAQVTVPAGEIQYSSYSGGNTALGLILVVEPIVSYNSSVTPGHFEIAGNSRNNNPYVLGNYLVAYFYRSGSTWESGPVISAYSDFPITINGKSKFITHDEIDSLIYRIDKGVSEKLLMGKFGNVSADSNGLPTGENAKRAGMLTTLALPYKEVTLRFHAPTNYVAGIRHGDVAQKLTNNTYWFRDGDTYTFPADSNYYRIIYAIQPTPNVSVYEDIDAEEVEAMIASGDISITYKPNDSGAISRNVPSGTRVAAACFLDGNLTQTGIDKFPIFLHTTDIHGDAYRLRDAIQLSKANNADALLVTGDVNGYNIFNGFDALESEMLASDVPVAYCRGNHESYGNSDTSFDVFTKYYSNLATKWGYLKASDTTTDKTYYYKDFDAKKIRVIALDPYEKNITSNNAGAFSQAQIDWFIATLKNTPTDYGILCILHSPEAYPSSEMSIEPISGKTDFFIEGTPDYWSTPSGISGTPLKDIVDAFISRGGISKTFTQTTTGGVSETITISGDFTTGVNTGVEFVAWACGHQHLDLVGVYKNTTNRQVVLNMTCGVCYYGSSSYPYLCNVSDLPRNSIGVTQDAINIYAIDRTNKVIRIARIGADMTASFKKREVMTIPYAD